MKYNLNIDIFEVIDTEEKAYWLGFLFADGYVMKDKVELTLGKLDREHLQKFRSFIGLPEEYKTNISEKYSYERVNACSRKLVADLTSHGCINKKTHFLKYPLTIPENLQHHFIRGYFDGDGCIGYYSYKGRDTLCDFRLEGNEEFLLKVQKILIQNCGLNITKLYKRHKDREDSIKTLKYAGRNSIKKIFEFLYLNATVFLERKEEKFQYINNYILLTSQKI